MLEKQQRGVVHAEHHQRENADSTRLPDLLPAEINAATRTLHTALNRLITSRLPLALPPHSHDSALYAAGLVHFAHVFLTFESLWADLLRSPASVQSHTNDHGASFPPFSPLLSYLLINPYDSPSLFTSTLGAPTPPSPALLEFLSTLRPKGLVRSGRLKRDLEFLLGLHSTDLEVLLAKYPGDAVADFCTHIRKSVNEKPWTLVAYAWCFYMAVFSGGRWIRAGLLGAGDTFWPESSDAASPSSTLATAGTDDMTSTADHGAGSRSTDSLKQRGLSFWHFPGPVDGDDIKSTFRTRLLAAEDLLSPDERIDIIEEAKYIFRSCATMVEDLDMLIGTDSGLIQQQKKGEGKEEKQDVVEEAAVAVHQSEKSAYVATALGKGEVKDGGSITNFLRRPEITGVLVAVGCLACFLLVRVQ